MNIEYFREALDFISYTGITLNAEKTMLIENSLIILQNENKFQNMFFWGCINGIERDYYVAFGYNPNSSLERKYFYSLNCVDWNVLETPNSNLFEACIICPERFVGDISFTVKVKLDPKVLVDENGIASLDPHTEKVKLKEGDRLACMVHLITEESALIPRGGLYEMPDKNIIFNPLFHGLNEIEVKDLSNYQLFRKPRNKYNENLLKRHNYNYATDFLDTLDDIIPKDFAFAVSMERDNRLILIKSLLWHGMIFFHKINSRKHGFMYMGNSKKNFDLLFMTA